MKRIWKLQYEFADARINWFSWYHYSSSFLRSCAFKIWYCKTQHMYCSLPSGFMNVIFFCHKSMWPLFKIRWSRNMHKGLDHLDQYVLTINFLISLPKLLPLFLLLIYFSIKMYSLVFLKKKSWKRAY